MKRKYLYSYYNITFDYFDKIGIFNLKTNKIYIDSKEKVNEISQNNFSSINNEIIDKLFEDGILTEYENEEKILLDARKHSIENLNDNLTLVILTTTTCNANCYYCYQHEKDSKIIKSYLESKTIIKIIDYIKENQNNNPVNLWFFGGEPLLNSKAISNICKELKENHIDFNSYIITNGFLIDKYVKLFKYEWNIKNVQVTIDDIGLKYNSIKSYNVAKIDAFTKVINNITLLLNEKIYTKIRINFDVNNYNNVFNIIDFFYKKYGRNKYLKLSCSPIIGQNLETTNDVKLNPFIVINEKLIKLKYITRLSDIGIRNNNIECMIYSKSNAVIDCEGNMYKCEHLIPKGKDMRYYNLHDKKFITDNYDKWMTPEVPNKCLKCKVLPICYGGCKFKEYFFDENSNCIPIKNCISKLLTLYYENVEPLK